MNKHNVIPIRNVRLMDSASGLPQSVGVEIPVHYTGADVYVGGKRFAQVAFDRPALRTCGADSLALPETKKPGRAATLLWACGITLTSLWWAVTGKAAVALSRPLNRYGRFALKRLIRNVEAMDAACQVWDRTITTVQFRTTTFPLPENASVNNLTITNTQKCPVTAICKNAAGSPVTPSGSLAWNSSNPDAVTVSASNAEGTSADVHGLLAGTSTITCSGTNADGSAFTGSFEVTVTADTSGNAVTIEFEAGAPSPR